MTKEQALQILQEAIDRGIDPDEDVEIFDAIKIAIECLQSDPNAPAWLPDRPDRGALPPLCARKALKIKPPRT